MQTAIRPSLFLVVVPRSCPVDLSNLIRQGAWNLRTACVYLSSTLRYIRKPSNRFRSPKKHPPFKTHSPLQGTFPSPRSIPLFKKHPSPQGAPPFSHLPPSSFQSCPSSMQKRTKKTQNEPSVANRSDRRRVPDTLPPNSDFIAVVAPILSR